MMAVFMFVCLSGERVWWALRGVVEELWSWMVLEFLGRCWYVCMSEEVLSSRLTLLPFYTYLVWAVHRCSIHPPRIISYPSQPC